jgi:hypothetical protein
VFANLKRNMIVLPPINTKFVWNKLHFLWIGESNFEHSLLSEGVCHFGFLPIVMEVPSPAPSWSSSPKPELSHEILCVNGNILETASSSLGPTRNLGLLLPHWVPMSIYAKCLSGLSWLWLIPPASCTHNASTLCRSAGSIFLDRLSRKHQTVI